MSNSKMKDVKDFVQYVSAIVSLVINLFLIHLILTKSPKKLGSYKHLMIYFAFALILLTFLEVMERPCVLAHDYSFAVVVERKPFLDGPSETFLLSLSCGICGMTMSMFAVHFIFRYFAMERKGKLKHFRGRFLILWMLLPVAVGLLWSAIVYSFIGINERQRITDYVGEQIFKTYGLNVTEVDFIGAVYYTVDQNNNKIANLSVFIGMGLLASIMGTSLVVILYFGVMIKRRIDNLVMEGRSAYTQSLQKQLFKALLIQTILPIIFVFAPLGVLFYLPIFCIDISAFSKIANLALAIYPALDPFPTIFFVDNYRNAVREYFYPCDICSKRVGPEPESDMSTISTEQQQ